MGPPPKAIRDLPVADTASTVFRLLFGNFGHWLRAALIPYLVSTLLFVVMLGGGDTPLTRILVPLINLVPYTLFAVAWNRLVLLGPEAAAPGLLSMWQGRHWRYYAFAVLYSLASSALLMTMLTLFGPGELSEGEGNAMSQAMQGAGVAGLALAIVLYLALRLGFVFPAVSVDERYGPLDSWRHTRGQGLRMFGTVAIILIPTVLAGSLLLSVVGTAVTVMAGRSDAAALAFSVMAGSALGYLVMTLFLTVVAVAFRTCTGWIPAEGGPPALVEDEEEN